MFGLSRRRAPGIVSAEPPAPPGRAWSSLPPLERTSGDVELTALTSSFISRLTARRRLDVSLAPLGHDVRLDAPAGIATGIAQVVQLSAAGPSLDLRPRRLRRLLRRDATPAGPVVARDAVPDEEQLSVEVPRSEEVNGSDVATDVDAVVERRLVPAASTAAPTVGDASPDEDRRAALRARAAPRCPNRRPTGRNSLRRGGN